jgi:hypothetical protein
MMRATVAVGMGLGDGADVAGWVGMGVGRTVRVGVRVHVGVRLGGDVATGGRDGMALGVGVRVGAAVRVAAAVGVLAARWGVAGEGAVCAGAAGAAQPAMRQSRMRAAQRARICPYPFPMMTGDGHEDRHCLNCM